MRVSLYIIKLLLLFLVYAVTGIYGLTIQSVNDFATLIWLPTGIALAALLCGGYRLWPAVFLGAYVVNLVAGAPFFVILGIAAGNTLEVLVSYTILKRFVHFQKSLEHVRDLFSLIFFAGPVGSLISSTIGVTSLLLGGVITQQDFYPTWSAWIVGDCLSTMIVTPFILIWSNKISFQRPSPLRILEGVSVSIFLLLLCFFVFTDFFVLHHAPISYLLFVPLVWIALRFGQRATITAVLVITIFVFWGTLNQLGPFAHEHLEQSITYIKTYILTIALTAFSLSTILNERQRLSRRKDEFISIASHELKTPITSISLLMHLLQKRFNDKTDPESKRIIKKTTEQVQKMSDLVEDLLDISKIQMEQLVLRKEKFAIDTLVDEVLGNMRRITKTHKILRKGRAKKIIFADKERITQVLINLISNAIKYSPNSKRILISLRASKQYVSVEITDFGIGIEKKNQEKIFERFFRISEPSENTFPGLGVGLYIAIEIVEKHHGMLSVKSLKGKGSTFSFSLPLAG